MKQTKIIEELQEEKIDFGELEESDIACPKCETLLKIYPEGTSPDDYTTALICSHCGYFERE